jgi:PAS domain S-box-containing protein
MTIAPSGHEIELDSNELIVSKTDTKGYLTYCNASFIRISGYRESELLGQPHSIIRHPDMPRCVFELLWQTIACGEEFFGYIQNLCKEGSHYWVFATVTPSFKPGSREIIGYYSVRRKADKHKLELMRPLYAKLLQAEAHIAPAQGIQNSRTMLNQTLAETGKSYREFILTL